MGWLPRLEFGICDRLVARFAPREENAAYLYFVRRARLQRFGLRDPVLIGCCLGSLAGLVNIGFCLISVYLTFGYLSILMLPVRNLAKILKANGQGVDLMTAPISSPEFVAAVRAHLNLSTGAAGIVGGVSAVVTLFTLFVQVRGVRLYTVLTVGTILIVTLCGVVVLSRLLVWCLVLGKGWTVGTVAGIVAAFQGIRFAEKLSPGAQLEWVSVGVYCMMVLGVAALLSRVASARCERVFVRRVCDELFP